MADDKIRATAEKLLQDLSLLPKGSSDKYMTRVLCVESALRAVQREAIEAAAKVADSAAQDAIHEGNEGADRLLTQALDRWCSDIATAIRALLPPTPKGE